MKVIVLKNPLNTVTTTTFDLLRKYFNPDGKPLDNLWEYEETGDYRGILVKYKDKKSNIAFNSLVKDKRSILWFIAYYYGLGCDVLVCADSDKLDENDIAFVNNEIGDGAVKIVKIADDNEKALKEILDAIDEAIK
jgi:hypothetical protein